MISKLNIRKRLVFFGAIWMTVCTVILTVTLFSEGRRALLEGVAKRSQNLAGHLAEQVRGPLYAGNKTAIEVLLREMSRQPGVVAAFVLLKNETYGSKPEDVEPLSRLKNVSAHFVMVNGLRAIESVSAISLQPEISPEEIPLGETAGHEEDGRAIVLLSVEPVFAQVRTLMIRTVLSLLFVLAAGLLIGWVFSGKMVSPLRRMADHARKIAEGEATGKKSLPNEDEIDMVLSLMTSMRHSLDYKKDEIAGLQVHLKDTSKKSSDLEGMNTRFSDLLNHKNDLIRLLNHEVKTPLGTISNLITGLQEEIPGPITDRQRGYLTLIRNNSERVRRVIAVMLQHAIAKTGDIQINRHQVQISEVAQQVQSALVPFQEERQVACVIGESVSGKSVYADSVLIDQILYNLIHNAIKASSPGARVTIEVFQSGSDCVISVEDSGSGIPKEIDAKLLQKPLSNDIRQGGGVGLYISRYLVDLHGGRIWFTTKEGKGTTFFFTLPTSTAPVVERT